MESHRGNVRFDEEHKMNTQEVLKYVGDVWKLSKAMQEKILIRQDSAVFQEFETRRLVSISGLLKFYFPRNFYT